MTRGFGDKTAGAGHRVVGVLDRTAGHRGQAGVAGHTAEREATSARHGQRTRAAECA